MTAEIAVINKSAVALAADSKVTLSRGGKQKTYDTVDKLFSISKTEPVGAMIYGNAEFMRFPWETILKEYRRRDPRKKFDTVFLWAENLFEFLLGFFPFKEDDEDFAALSIVEAWLQHYWETCARASQGPDQFKANYIAEIKAAISELKKLDDFLTDDEWTAFQKRLAPKLEAALKRGFLSQFGDIIEDLRTFAELTIYGRPIPRQVHPVWS